MKHLLILVLTWLGMAYCTQTPNITANPDDHAATSGTVGSAKATTELPRKRADSTRTIDSFSRKPDSALPNGN